MRMAWKGVCTYTSTMWHMTHASTQTSLPWGVTMTGLTKRRMKKPPISDWQYSGDASGNFSCRDAHTCTLMHTLPHTQSQASLDLRCHSKPASQPPLYTFSTLNIHQSTHTALPNHVTANTLPIHTAHYSSPSPYTSSHHPTPSPHTGTGPHHH